jgi:hypothetical protein
MSRLLCLATIATLAFATSAHADSITVPGGGGPIVGEDQSFVPTVSATFDFSYTTAGDLTDGQLVLTLTYITGSRDLITIGEALSSATFELGGYTGTLGAVSAIVASGSSLTGTNLNNWTNAANWAGLSVNDVSGYWKFKDSVDTSLVHPDGGTIGGYGVSGVGDLLNGLDSFGNGDIIDSSKTLPKTGADTETDDTFKAGQGDFMIVPTGTDFTKDGFTSQGPMVMTQLDITFNFSGSDDLTSAMVGNVDFYFGTDGQPIVPEPGTLGLFGLALGGFWLWRRRR